MQLVIWGQCDFLVNLSVGKHLWIQFLLKIFFYFFLFFLPNTLMWIGKGVLELLFPVVVLNILHLNSYGVLNFKKLLLRG